MDATRPDLSGSVAAASSSARRASATAAMTAASLARAPRGERGGAAVQPAAAAGRSSAAAAASSATMSVIGVALRGGIESPPPPSPPPAASSARVLGKPQANVSAWRLRASPLCIDCTYPFAVGHHACDPMVVGLDRVGSPASLKDNVAPVSVSTSPDHQLGRGPLPAAASAGGAVYSKHSLRTDTAAQPHPWAAADRPACEVAACFP